MRKELKYYMNEHKAFLLHKLLSCFCMPDQHNNGEYTVHSLYFDRLDNHALHEKLEGIKTTGKVRIRYYDDEHEYKLEYKFKKGDFVNKQSINITTEVVDEILNDSRTINNYFETVQAATLKPKVMIVYDRKVLVYPQSGIRFTFDYRTRCTTSSRADIHKDQLFAAVFDQPTVVFEVKYTDEIPIHLKRILTDFGVQSSISKYAVSRTNI